MLSKKKEISFSFYLRKIFTALGIAFLFALLSLYPGLGFKGEARIMSFSVNPQLLYRDVDIACNVTYNPLLFIFSWLMGQGQTSYVFTMRQAPKGANQFSITWPTWEETKEEALLIVTLNELFSNLPYNFLVLLLIEIVKIRSFYLSFIGGILGFPIAGWTGSIFGFSVGLILGFILNLKFKNKDIFEISKLIWRKIKDQIE